MRKQIISLLLIFLMVAMPMVFAQREPIKVGALPNNKLNYGVKKFFEKMDLALTFSQERKMEKLEFYANTRQQELERLSNLKLENENLIEDLTTDLNEKINDLEILGGKRLSNAENLALQYRLKLMREKHTMVLEKVQTQLKERNKETNGIGDALYKSRNEINLIDEKMNQLENKVEKNKNQNN